MKFVLVLIMCLNLVACSGGSNSESENHLAIASSEANQLFSSKSAFARNFYNGSRDELPLTLVSAPEIISSINLGLFPDTGKLNANNTTETDWSALSLVDITNLPFFPSLPETTNLYLKDGVHDCLAGGSMILEGLSLDTSLAVPPAIGTIGSYRHVSVDYSECRASEAGSTFDGHVDIFYSIKNFDDINVPLDADPYFHSYIDSLHLFGNMMYGFDGLIINNKGQSIQLDGAFKWDKADACGADGFKELTANVLNINTDESVLIDNMVMGWRTSQNGDCHRDNSRMTYFNGIIYHSKYGKVVVESPSVFYDAEYIYPRFSTGLPEQYSHLPYADIQLTSAGTKASLTDTAEGDHSSVEARKINFFLFDRTGSRIHASDITQTMFVRGGLLDLNDDDADGMSNSWEMAAGLDKDNPGDAWLDPDADFASNLQEYRAAGDPTWTEFSGRTREITFSDNSEVKLGYYGWEDTIGITLYLDGNYADSVSYSEEGPIYLDDYLVLKADVEGTWNPENPACIVEKSDNTLHCKGTNLRSFAGGFLPVSSGPVTISATVALLDFDFYPENNSVSFTIDYVSSQ